MMRDERTRLVKLLSAMKQRLVEAEELLNNVPVGQQVSEDWEKCMFMYHKAHGQLPSTPS